MRQQLQSLCLFDINRQQAVVIAFYQARGLCHEQYIPVLELYWDLPVYHLPSLCSFFLLFVQRFLMPGCCVLSFSLGSSNGSSCLVVVGHRMKLGAKSTPTIDAMENSDEYA